MAAAVTGDLHGRRLPLVSVGDRWCPLVSVGVRWCVTVGDRQPLQERGLESGELYRLLTDFTGGVKKN